MNARSRPALLVLWLAALTALAGYVVQALRVDSDLRLFLPDAATPEQALVLDGIGEGPAARLLLVALQGAEAAELAAASRALADELREHPAFLRIENGASVGLPEALMRYRYLLSPAMDQRRLDAETLRTALQERIQDLGTPAGPLLESLVPADPTLEALAAVEWMAAGAGPERREGVWFDGDGRRALLLVQTVAAGFAPDAQQAALDALEQAFDRARRGDPGMRMAVSGPGAFSALMKERTQADATRLGSAAAVLLLLLLFAAYRRAGVVALAMLPLATAGLAGLAAVCLVYPQVHGITLAFGFTLIGVAQDYPIHFFSHQRPGADPADSARSLWPTLATGVASTCVAYLSFLASGVTGLGQLACFTVAGLAAAGLSTRFLLPRVTATAADDQAQSAMIRRADRWLALPPLPRAPYAAAAALCLAAAIAAPGPFWEDDLGRLTPVPRERLEEYIELRDQLGAPDARHLAVVTAPDAQGALEALEALDPGLAALVGDGSVEAYQHAARLLPSVHRQRERQAALPEAAQLAQALDSATQGLPYRAGVFAPFLEDVARARELAPLTPGGPENTPQQALAEGLLRQRDGATVALVTFTGVDDPAALARWVAASGAGVMLVDLKQASVALVVRQRERMLLSLALAAVLLALVVRAGLGGWRRTVAVLAPMALTTLAVVAILRLGGQSLNLFHLVSLILTAGLGLDYALFIERAGNAEAPRLRTLHAVLVCAASTFLVFALLSLSSIPVLESIGMTVALGVLLNFFLALGLRRGPPGHERA